MARLAGKKWFHQIECQIRVYAVLDSAQLQEKNREIQTGEREDRASTVRKRP